LTNDVGEASLLATVDSPTVAHGPSRGILRQKVAGSMAEPLRAKVPEFTPPVVGAGRSITG
jgi:hypothetical protein